MSTVGSRTKATVEEYFAYDESIQEKAEYLNGEIFVMAGASLDHNRISSNLHFELRKALSGTGCEVFQGDLKIEMSNQNAYYYPDISIFYGPVDLANERDDVARNPMVVVEILTNSTSPFKMHQYMKIPSLREFVIIEQSRPMVDIYWRNAAGKWEFETESNLEGSVTFNALKTDIAMRDIYANVKFGEE